jgi:hypothetical protein
VVDIDTAVADRPARPHGDLLSTPLDRIDPRRAEAIAKRVIKKEPDVGSVDVAAFNSSI